MTKEDLYDKFKDILASPSTIEHIFVGEINRRGNAVGFHYEGQFSSGISKIIPETKKPVDSNNVYEADVEIKSQSKHPRFSSFFPQEWSEEEVLNQIQVAYKNKRSVTPTLYEGTTEKGLDIQFYLDASGKILTAYPIYLGV
ncbi:MAG: EndoU domain-containing protein [Tumebacillaceae bacterium]